MWNMNAARMIKNALPIPREVPVFMPDPKWKEEGVPMMYVDRFNRYVANLCRSTFAPCCNYCGHPIAPDCTRTMTITQLGLRFCNVCKVDAFVSDYELFIKYDISMKHRFGCAVAAPSDIKEDDASSKGKKKLSAACASDEQSTDEASTGEDDVKKKSKKKLKNAPKTKKEKRVKVKKAPAARPPPKIKKMTVQSKKRAASHNPFYRRDANGYWERALLGSSSVFSSTAAAALPKYPTVFERIMNGRDNSGPEIFFIANTGAHRQRCEFTSSPINLAGTAMEGRLNMLFFLTADVHKVFDLKRAYDIKLRKDAARSLLGAIILRRISTRDITWALPWSGMTPVKKHLIWDRIISTRHSRTTNPQHIMYPGGWEPLSSSEMQMAQARQYRCSRGLNG